MYGRNGIRFTGRPSGWADISGDASICPGFQNDAVFCAAFLRASVTRHKSWNEECSLGLLTVVLEHFQANSPELFAMLLKAAENTKTVWNKVAAEFG